MSAITGIFNRNGKNIKLSQFQKMNSKLSHRGRGNSKNWIEGNMALGHQMLWTTKESLIEELPFHDEDLKLIITSDARIDNREELSNILNIENSTEVSDSYYILKSYEKWGENCPKHLLGDFSFAIWDDSQQKLFCARDHMGIKPFYYFLSNDVFIFGTEIKAIIDNDYVPYELNEYKLALFLMKDTENNKLTFYKDIFELPGGHSIVLNKSEFDISCYWQLDPNLEIIMDSEEDYVKKFLELFEESVKCRLRSCFPVGSELSGGLDSSSIVSVAKNIRGANDCFQPFCTFSQIFEETLECDEKNYINTLIDDTIEPFFINVDNISPLNDIDTILWYQDQPFYTPHITKQIQLYKHVQDRGVHVLLSGQGGDQVLSLGNNYFKELAVTNQWKMLINEINDFSKMINTNRFTVFKEKVIYLLLPYKLKKFIKIFLGINDESIINLEFAQSLGFDLKNYYNHLNDVNKLNTKEIHYKKITSSVNETVFGTIDRRVANFGIEVRFPFYDKRLVEFCYAIPNEMKFKNGWNRYILREAMKNIMPDEIRERVDKNNFSKSFEKSFIKYEFNYIQNILKNDKLIRNYVNLELFNSCRIDRFKESDFFDLWIIILISIWLNQFKKRFNI
ncbi:asparagine synthase [Methanobacterium lacus]|uniref:Putative asparagine synthetase [glutamine-hydrolyzing] n=1 Tax=Methanobacterium lacus (strain AL-21) TaxID=877455 RepID=F0TBL9_METLA|nr:lasso peptide isopeptide bond-forming cyclase [Methanobacterium lacus]ADZ09096.1 asparagine synthase [Methanobacterium lacus]